MFGYMKEELERKISELDKKIELKKIKENEYRLGKNHIDKYFELKNNIQFNKVSLSFLALFMVFLPIFDLSVWLITLCECVSCFPLVATITSLYNNKSELKNKYSDITDYSNSELFQKRKILSEKEERIYSELFFLINEKEHYNSIADKMDLYNDIIEKYTKDPCYKADSKEEYELLSSSLELSDRAFNDFIEEKVDYSKVSFNSSIDNTVGYPEPVKKLIRK